MIVMKAEVTNALLDFLDDGQRDEALAKRCIRGYRANRTPVHRQRIFTALALLPEARQREIQQLCERWSDT